MATPVTDHGREFAKRVRRFVGMREQQTAMAAFGKTVPTLVEGFERLANIAVSNDHGPTRRVREIVKGMAAIQRADPDHSAHRVIRFERSGRTLTLVVVVLALGPHPIKGIDDERCVSIYRFDYVIERKDSFVLPSPLMAISDHALARLFERSPVRHPVETMPGVLFDLTMAAPWVLAPPAGERFVRRELCLPFDGGAALAVSTVRLTADGSDRLATMWIDIRTVLSAAMATPAQRQQADAVAAVMAGVQAGLDLDPLQRAVLPLERKIDHISRTLQDKVAARLASQKGNAS